MTAVAAKGKKAPTLAFDVFVHLDRCVCSRLHFLILLFQLARMNSRAIHATLAAKTGVLYTQPVCFCTFIYSYSNTNLCNQFCNSLVSSFLSIIQFVFLLLLITRCEEYIIKETKNLLKEVYSSIFSFCLSPTALYLLMTVASSSQSPPSPPLPSSLPSSSSSST